MHSSLAAHSFRYFLKLCGSHGSMPIPRHDSKASRKHAVVCIQVAAATVDGGRAGGSDGFMESFIDRRIMTGRSSSIHSPMHPSAPVTSCTSALHFPSLCKSIVAISQVRPSGTEELHAFFSVRSQAGNPLHRIAEVLADCRTE